MGNTISDILINDINDYFPVFATKQAVVRKTLSRHIFR